MTSRSDGDSGKSCKAGTSPPKNLNHRKKTDRGPAGQRSPIRVNRFRGTFLEKIPAILAPQNREASYTAYFDNPPLEVIRLFSFCRGGAVECARSPCGNVANGRWLAVCANDVRVLRGQRLNGTSGGVCGVSSRPTTSSARPAADAQCR